MTAMSPTLVVAEMQARDLARRRAVMALLVALPALFYYSVPAGDDYGVLAGSIGVSWAVAAAAMFGVLGWRRVDPRLALLGVTARQGLTGRLVLLAALAVALVALFAPQILTRSSALIAEPATMLLALGLMAVVSVPLGLAIGALVPREMEATLVLIGVVGVEMSVPPGTAGAWLLPLWGPLELIGAAASGSDATGTGTAHALAATSVLLAVAAWAWHRRVRLAGEPAGPAGPACSPACRPQPTVD